ncbi:MAG TPA: DUF5698 domain-containing protein [Anaerolineales bacterium]|nr:DUF5698 domain-containing protein [Anaerolineales bacterium]
MNPAVVSALTIFVLRMLDITLYTVRITMVMRGRKLFAWIFGFCQAVVFVVAIRQVLVGLDNWLNIAGYAAGFATGNVAGMLIEGRLAIGITHLRVVSPRRGAELAEHLRSSGYAVTEVAGRGIQGVVGVINCSVRRREAPQVTRLVAEIDDQAYITAEDVRLVWHGFWGSK